ncbi:hypothetical protein [Nocardia brasiliensis]|uniref:hypothetical protein n=1 Tax=Nocardia brasiliensis TaxID=37326 RepID=UPI0024540E0A|nr:hypothetical protein [Nocardia brasiliensis]
MAGFQKANDYVEVNERIVEFREKHPHGSFQPVDPKNPFEVKEIAGQTVIIYTAAAYRTPDDERPGIGVAQEAFPGKTPYTKGSEIQNAETSAWGRAIVAALAADTKRGIASANEVRNRQAEQAAEKTAPPTAADTTRTKILATAKNKGMSPADLAGIYHDAGGKGKLSETDDADLLGRVLAAVESVGNAA